MVSFIIEFNKPDQKYKAGEIVHCRITVNNAFKFKARSLSIRFKGYAQTQWQKIRTDDQFANQGPGKNIFSGNEEYFRNYQYIFGSQNSSTDHEVLEGTNVYKVSFTLPLHIPSSLKRCDGCVAYDVKAKFDTSWGSLLDKESSAAFFVIPTLDLDEFPHLRNPIKTMDQKTFGYYVWKSQPMLLINILPKTGFFIGDTIPLTIQIDNGSDVHLESICVKLKERIQYITTSPRIDTRMEIKTVHEHCIEAAVKPFQKRVFETTIFLDPSFDWKFFNGCGIINVSYQIKTEAVVSGFNRNFENRTPGITIGAVPFRTPINGGQAIPTAPVEDPVIMDPHLPSYNEAARGPSPIDGASGGIGWNLTTLGELLATTEKIFVDNLPPPSFEESQKRAILETTLTAEKSLDTEWNVVELQATSSGTLLTSTDKTSDMSPIEIPAEESILETIISAITEFEF